MDSSSAAATAYLELMLYSYKEVKKELHHTVDSEFYIDYIDRFDVLLAGTLSFIRKSTKPVDFGSRKERISRYIGVISEYIDGQTLSLPIKSYLMLLLCVGSWIMSLN